MGHKIRCYLIIIFLFLDDDIIIAGMDMQSHIETYFYKQNKTRVIDYM